MIRFAKATFVQHTACVADMLAQRLYSILAVVVAASFLAGPAAQCSPPVGLSPVALVASPDGSTLYLGCATGSRVLVFDIASRKVTRSVPVAPNPTGLCLSADGQELFVTCAAPVSRVCVVKTAQGWIAREFRAGHTAMAPVLSPDGKTLFVCNRFDDDVSVLDLATGRELRRIPVRREPVAAALTPDGQRLLVANHLPAGRADASHVAAVISVIDPALGRVVDELSLPSGSGGLNDLRIAPDGKHAVVTHLLARFQRPTTQVERGWMNSNAATILDLERLCVLNTVLLDEPDRGAANPWGVAWSADSRTLVIAHAGTHEVSVVNFAALLAKLAKLTPEPLPANVPLPYGARARAPADVSNDLSFLAGLRERRPLPAGDLGPRAVVVAGTRAYTANYFSDTLSALELDGSHPQAETIPLGPQPRLTAARRGELYFHDARLCSQGWQSCASCHPGDARMDGLNWDLLNDGIGNPKNTRSLLLAARTPPAMSLGVRETAKTAVRAGLRHILFTVQPPAVAEAIDEYLKSLKPLPSPRLVNGQLSPAARRGGKLFRSRETRCAQCHPPPLFTNLKSYDVGTRGPRDGAADTFDTPTLIELWRTAPYLHDGSVATLRDLLTLANQNDRHGKTSHLTADQIRDLCEYLLSL
jgi:YVTN family beta-propeller protein